MVTLEVTKKTMTTSMVVIVKELGTRKGKWFLSIAQLWHNSREYNLQKEGKSPSHVWAWFIKNVPELLFGKE